MSLKYGYYCKLNVLHDHYAGAYCILQLTLRTVSDFLFKNNTSTLGICVWKCTFELVFHFSHIVYKGKISAPIYLRWRVPRKIIQNIAAHFLLATFVILAERM